MIHFPFIWKLFAWLVVRKQCLLWCLWIEQGCSPHYCLTEKNKTKQILYFRGPKQQLFLIFDQDYLISCSWHFPLDQFQFGFLGKTEKKYKFRELKSVFWTPTKTKTDVPVRDLLESELKKYINKWNKNQVGIKCKQDISRSDEEPKQIRQNTTLIRGII